MGKYRVILAPLATRIARHTGRTVLSTRTRIHFYGLKDEIFKLLAIRYRAFSVGDPVAVKSVRHALWKLHAGNGLALKVRRIDDYEVTAIPDRVVDVRQMPARKFAPTRIRRSEHGLCRSPRLRSGAE